MPEFIKDLKTKLERNNTIREFYIVLTGRTLPFPNIFMIEYEPYETPNLLTKVKLLEDKKYITLIKQKDGSHYRIQEHFYELIVNMDERKLQKLLKYHKKYQKCFVIVEKKCYNTMSK
jgi:hypothetical protein